MRESGVPWVEKMNELDMDSHLTTTPYHDLTARLGVSIRITYHESRHLPVVIIIVITVCKWVLIVI
jgi:hypothetical protein